MKQRTLAALIMAGGLTAPAGAALAQDWTSPNFYAGAGLGYFAVEEQDFFGPDDELDDEQAAFKIYGGGDFSRWLSAEASYVNFGELGDDNTTELDGLGVSLLAQWPVGNFAPYLKVGQLWWEADTSIAGIDASDDGNDTFGGVGVRFALTEQLDLRAEWERYQFEEVDADMGSLNLQWQF